MRFYPPTLQTSKSPSARVTSTGEASWRLEIPPHSRPGYHLAQLDDYGSHRRKSFPWKSPLVFSLQARVSAEDLPGTWGFGLWNDPFSFMVAYNRLVPRVPTLPQAAWFFHASSQNYLSLRDDLPANGFLAATFCSTRLPTALLSMASPLLSLLLLPVSAQWIRSLLRRVVKQDTVQVDTRVSEWHAYQMEWDSGQVRFSVDGVNLLQTNIVPHPPLSLVIWVDNQYAAFPPRGGLKYGILPYSQPAWMEIREVCLETQGETGY